MAQEVNCRIDDQKTGALKKVNKRRHVHKLQRQSVSLKEWLAWVSKSFANQDYDDVTFVENEDIE